MKKLPLNLVYLKYFCDAVKHNSISASAKNNSVSQSAISQAISKLEEEMRCDLITHQPNRFKTTENGEKLFEAAKGIFQAIQAAEDFLQDERHGKIDFACTHSFALALLPAHLQRVQQSLPHLQINFRLGHTDSIKEWIKKGMIDFGIVLDNEDLSGFDCEEIYEGRYQTYISKTSPSSKELSFLLSEERMETNSLKKAYKKEYGVDLPVLMEISSWEVISSLAEKGLGVGFVPDYVVQDRHPNLIPYPLCIDPTPYKICAIFSKNSKRNPRIRPFLDLFQKEFSK